MSDRFDYAALLRAATVGLVRQVLADVAANGLEGDHHFYLTFRTEEPGVEIPAELCRRYPETMTIVLQHQFAELVVEDDALAVTLRFGGSWERLRVPFAALTTFLDPSVPFGLDFTQFAGAPVVAGEAAAGEPPGSGPREAPRSATDGAPGGEPPSGDLLPFRRR